MIKYFQIFESFNNDPFNIKDTFIFYDDISEAEILIDILEYFGYVFYIKTRESLHKHKIYNTFVSTNKEYDFCLGYRGRSNRKYIKVKTLLNKIKEKYPNLNLKKRKNIELDPYDEENWGLYQESIEGDPLGVAYSNILYNSIEEAIKIAEVLYKYGYEVYGYPEPDEEGTTLKDFAMYWNSFVPDHNYFVSGRAESYNMYPSITFEEFMKRDNKKLKKIKNIELDPYGEEDWGVTIQEKKRNFKEKTLFIRDPINSFKDLNIKDITSSLRGSKITNKLKKEIGNHYVQFEDDRGRIYKSIVKNVRIKFLPDEPVLYYNLKRKKFEDGKNIKIGGVKIYFDIPHERYRWNKSISIKLGQPIIIYEPRRIYRDIDPYGEENWEV